MKLYKSLWMSREIVIMLILLLFISVLTGCEAIEFLLEQNEKYEEEDRLESEANKSKIDDGKVKEEVAVIEEELDDEFNFTDELVAADGLIINRELDYESFIGRSGQSIIEELLVVRRDSEHRYGDVLSYNGNKFFCNTEDICYAVFVKKDTVLGLKFPTARTKIVELMGSPILANDEFQFYQYLDYVIRVPSVNNEVKHGVVAKDLNGLIAFMSSFNEETAYQLDTMLNSNKFDIMSRLGPSERDTIGSADVMHYDYQGIYLLLKGEEGDKKSVKVLMTKYGGFGINIGDSRQLLDEFYIEPIVSSSYYLYQYEDTYYSVFFENDIVIGLQVMTEDEALALDTDIDPLAWADMLLESSKKNH